MFGIPEAVRIQGRIALLVAIGCGIILFAPQGFISPLALEGLRQASFYWAVGVVFLFSVGLSIIRLGEILVAARRNYRSDDDLRVVLKQRLPNELSLLNRARTSGKSTLFIPPAEVPEVKPLVALGLLTQVEPIKLPHGPHGIFLVPPRVMAIIQEKPGGWLLELRRRLYRIARALASAALPGYALASYLGKTMAEVDEVRKRLNESTRGARIVTEELRALNDELEGKSGEGDKDL